jgi:glycosyltransferase involved in cell wall biosynthesis
VKILHLYAGNLFGGVEAYLITLAKCRHLAPRMEPHFALCFPGRLRDELSATGVPVHDLGPVRFSRPWTLLRARRRLRRLLREQPFAAVVTHACWSHTAFAPVVRKAGVRLVNAVHDVLTGGNWIERWAAGTPPDLVITNSRFTAGPAGVLFGRMRISLTAKIYPRFTAGPAAELVPLSPVEVSYLPVPAPDIPDRDAVRRVVRAELGTPADAVVILQTSRLERWKGQGIHVEALARLKDLPGWEAWFAGGAQKAGEAEYLDELKLTARRAGIADRVRFLGQRSDVPRLMAAANVYCQPNTGPEPFGVAFVEALYSGLPTVGSASGGTVEIVTDSCGVLTPPGDAAAVADALAELIRDPLRRRKLGDSGPARAADLCDPAQCLARLCRLLGGGAA